MNGPDSMHQELQRSSNERQVKSEEVESEWKMFNESDTVRRDLRVN